MRFNFCHLRAVVLGTILSFVWECSHAGELDSVRATVPSPLPAGALAPKPAWLTELSLGIRESCDDNVYLSGVDAKFLPAAYTVPNGGTVALENQSSWVTTVSPKARVNFAPLLGDQNALSLLSMAYVPDFAVYADAPSESYSAHRVATAIKGGGDSVAVSVENTFTYVDGDELGLTYPGGFYNAIMNSTVRERRELMQDRGAASVRFDFDRWFVRPVGSLQYADYRTAQINLTGYQSYADRYDVNGGGDLGWKVRPKLALTLGYRYGHQYQQQFSYSPYSSSSDYQRVLAGLEGNPWSWLEVKIQGGPDFRAYEPNTATHLTPLNDLSPVKYYAEGSLAVTITTNDAVNFRCRQWQWVSSVGKSPYFDSTFEMSFHHQFTRKLGGDLTGKFISYDYRGGNLTTSSRFDGQYSSSVALAYAVSRHCQLKCGYSVDLGRNLSEVLANPETRSYERQLCSVELVVRY